MKVHVHVSNVTAPQSYPTKLSWFHFQSVSCTTGALEKQLQGVIVLSGLLKLLLMYDWTDYERLI